MRLLAMSWTGSWEALMLERDDRISILSALQRRSADGDLSWRRVSSPSVSGDKSEVYECSDEGVNFRLYAFDKDTEKLAKGDTIYRSVLTAAVAGVLSSAVGIPRAAFVRSQSSIFHVLEILDGKEVVEVISDFGSSFPVHQLFRTVRSGFTSADSKIQAFIAKSKVSQKDES